MLVKIPEVSLALQKYAGAGGDSEKALLFSMRELVGELERSTAAEEVRPFKFVAQFRQSFPMFAQQAEGGRGFMQQDAEECWSTIVTALAQRLKVSPGPEPSDIGSTAPPLLPRMTALRDNLGDALFGVEMRVRYKCIETDAEPAYEARAQPHAHPYSQPYPHPHPHPHPTHIHQPYPHHSPSFTPHPTPIHTPTRPSCRRARRCARSRAISLRRLPTSTPRSRHRSPRISRRAPRYSGAHEYSSIVVYCRSMAV